MKQEIMDTSDHDLPTGIPAAPSPRQATATPLPPHITKAHQQFP
ncbi:hypothetical protein [Methanocalculus natronophilus]|nr:hypothetical protein [Methanocalculus sp. AMF5]